MKTLLVAIDFSDTTEITLQQASALAAPLAAKIVLLHVVEPIATYVPVGASMDLLAAAPPSVAKPEDLTADERRLAELAQPLIASGLDVQCVTLVGLAVDDILEQAEQFDANCIVLGSHGHGALYHLFSGSVVTGVLKRAACPVLVVPAKKPA